MKILLNSFYVILAIVCFCGCSLFNPEKPPVKPIQESAAPNPAPEPVKSSVSFYDASGQARKLDLKKYPNAHTILLDGVDIEFLTIDEDNYGRLLDRLHIYGKALRCQAQQTKAKQYFQ